MGNLVNALNKLKTNLFGSPYSGVPDAIPRNSAIELAQKNPLAKMEYDDFGFSNICYPQSLSDYTQGGHYMLFYVNVQNVTKYLYTSAKDPSVSIGGTLHKKMSKEQFAANPELKDFGVTTNTEWMEKGGTQKPSYQDGLAAKGLGTNLDNQRVDLSKESRGVKTGLSSYHKTTSRITDSIALYLPPNVQSDYSVSYNAHRTGMLGFLAASGGGIIGAWNNNDLAKIARIAGGATLGFVEYAAKKAALGAAEFISSAEGGEELFNKAFGKADNPYMEVLFDKPELREFTYNFTFMPRNESERDDVQRIIQMFRFHMAPELRSDHNRFMTLPSEFDIHYMYQAEDGKASENDYYNKISTCVLQNCKVDYTPDKVTSHADGSPVRITMSLTFKETEMLTKQRINEGY